MASGTSYLVGMAKTWVLDTETKGTGAHVAPLPANSASGPARDAELALVRLARPPRPASAPAPEAGPLQFKLVDVASAAVLAEGEDAPATVAALARARSALDVRIYVRDRQHPRWRLLNLAQTRSLWRLAQRAPSQPAAPPG